MCGGTAETVSDAHPNPYPLTGWDAPATAGGIDRTGNCAAGATAKSLPGTGITYCVKADASCSAASGSCPLYVTINQGGTRSYFDRVADSAANGAFIAVLLDSLTDGNDVKDAFAELPRVIAHDYVGLDRQRVYVVGFSAGSGAITRALCHIAKARTVHAMARPRTFTRPSRSVARRAAAVSASNHRAVSAASTSSP
jgi:hypothetical protein